MVFASISAFTTRCIHTNHCLVVNSSLFAEDGSIPDAILHAPSFPLLIETTSSRTLGRHMLHGSCFISILHQQQQPAGKIYLGRRSASRFLMLSDTRSISRARAHIQRIHTSSTLRPFSFLAIYKEQEQKQIETSTPLAARVLFPTIRLSSIY